MSQKHSSAYQEAKPDTKDLAVLDLLDAMIVETDPRKVARRNAATAFYLIEGGAVTVRGLVEVNWPVYLWRPMCDAVVAGRYHTMPRWGGGTALALEVL
jgi:hypothetical protein